MRGKFAKLILAILIGLLALGGLGYTMLNRVDATTAFPSYDVVLPGNVPLQGRPAPYGQFIVTHNALTISATQNCGTVARTNGYGDFKAILCDVGTEPITGTLFARVTSTGELYTMSVNTKFPENTNTISHFTKIAPWTSLCLTSTFTTTVATCGIYVQTP